MAARLLGARSDVDQAPSWHFRRLEVHTGILTLVPRGLVLDPSQIGFASKEHGIETKKFAWKERKRLMIIKADISNSAVGQAA